MQVYSIGDTNPCPSVSTLDYNGRLMYLHQRQILTAKVIREMLSGDHVFPSGFSEGNKIDDLPVRDVYAIYERVGTISRIEDYIFDGLADSKIGEKIFCILQWLFEDQSQWVKDMQHFPNIGVCKRWIPECECDDLELILYHIGGSGMFVNNKDDVEPAQASCHIDLQSPSSGSTCDDSFSASSSSLTQSPALEGVGCPKHDVFQSNNVDIDFAGSKGNGVASGGTIHSSVPMPSQNYDDLADNNVVINCLAVMKCYGVCMYRYGVSTSDRFDWNGVRTAVRHYVSRGVKVRLISVSGFYAYDSGSATKVFETPVDITGMPGVRDIIVSKRDDQGGTDDVFTLRTAFSLDCCWVDNDNYRDWKKDERIEQDVRRWITEKSPYRKVGFTFDFTNGNPVFLPDFCVLSTRQSSWW